MELPVVNIFKQSFMHWKHLGYCSHKVKEKAQLDMAKEEGRKYTWRHAKEVRRIVRFLINFKILLLLLINFRLLRKKQLTIDNFVNLL